MSVTEDQAPLEPGSARPLPSARRALRGVMHVAKVVAGAALICAAVHAEWHLIQGTAHQQVVVVALAGTWMLVYRLSRHEEISSPLRRVSRSWVLWSSVLVVVDEAAAWPHGLIAAHLG
ncbi:hypothetical protein ACFWXO_43735 [Kitasatospora sp. NPDC059088]|uniref:hypothetical protein n=1 Tax=Kitasatospora sp. NPDC059088 TaxID=3346722 RepID=UPI0036C7B881